MPTMEEKLDALGLALPPPCPRGRFAPFRRSGDLVFLSGQIYEWNGRVTLEGPVDGAVTANAAREAAKTFALNLLYCLRLACEGELDRVSAVLRLGGFVKCAPGFDKTPFVIDGATDVFIDLFGDAGIHARTAVGACELPGNAAVEADAIVELMPA
ncbi:RidA family protein [Breoghania sp. L-A4]|uniref:RidA family protein n=1 Tax=Breoghania sp. L-A4 TaxID=2304600 RepID=UPI000E3601E7|nr:RidA family protein [Breoghania sp. L-A4]AXS38786.1 RidA family protein [Breoghania sp. L-A4]